MRDNKMVVILGALILGFVAIACSDPDKAALTADQKKELATLVDNLEREAGFRPIIPEHVPPKIDRIPIGQILGTPVSPEVSLSYDFSLDDGRDRSTPKDSFLAVMIISEWQRNAFPCAGLGDPIGPDVLVDTDIVVDDSSVAEVVLRIADDTMSHQLTFAAGTLCITVFFEWRFPQGTPGQLPEEMRGEGIRVIQSMLSGA